jgi:hypothetical protein
MDVLQAISVYDTGMKQLSNGVASVDSTNHNFLLGAYFFLFFLIVLLHNEDNDLPSR